MALIPPVGATPAVVPTVTPATVAPTDTTATSGSGFGDAVSKALDSIQTSETKTNDMAQAAATGRLQNVEDYLIQATDTQLTTQLTVAVRNKAVEAFNEIMRMQV
jgi:flagellar hook-basal body complex protein FliE